MSRLYGTVAPLVTPLTDAGQVDLESLKRLSDYLIEKKINCLYPCGTTGEMVYLSNKERKAVVETVVRAANHRVPVFAHVGAANTADTIELAKHAVDAGADGIGVVTPWYFQLSSQALVEFYCDVSHAVPADYPVYLYAIPQNAVNDITPAMASAIIERCPNVVGIKYSYPDMTRIQQFMTLQNGAFDVLVGPDHLYEAVVAIGGKGTVSGNAMIVPEHYAALTQALKEHDLEAATKIQRRTNILNAILCENNNIANYKTVLMKEHIIESNAMRKPMQKLSQQEADTLMERLEKAQYHTVLV